MKKIICVVFALVFLAACTPTKPVFCYELSAQEAQPGKNCIPSGGKGGS